MAGVDLSASAGAGVSNIGGGHFPAGSVARWELYWWFGSLAWLLMVWAAAEGY